MCLTRKSYNTCEKIKLKKKKRLGKKKGKCDPIHRKRESIQAYSMQEQLLDVADKDFKSPIINMFNELKEKCSKRGKIIKVSEQIRNINRETKTSTKCILCN